MAKKKGKIGLAAKLGKKANKAVKDNAGKPVDFGSGGSLPEGIDDGVAELDKCYFDQYKSGDNEGEYYFRASGIVVAPESHNGRHVKGLTTSIMEPMCDTPGRSRESVDDHIAYVMNELAKLGAETDDMEGVDDLEEIAAALQESRPYFSFRTWKGKATDEHPNPQTRETWQGACEFDPEDEGEPVEEEDDEEEDGEEEGDDDEVSEDEDDLDALAQAADDEKDSDAQNRLLELAKEVGADDDAVGETATWAEVVELINEASSDDDDEGEEEEEEGEDDWEPEKEEVYSYKPPKGRKVLDVEVTAVFRKQKTCNLALVSDPSKKFLKVPWDKLIRDE